MKLNFNHKDKVNRMDDAGGFEKLGKKRVDVDIPNLFSRHTYILVQVVKGYILNMHKRDRFAWLQISLPVIAE